MYCRKCGVKVNVASQSCARCGVKMADDSQGYSRVSCKQCGDILKPDANYCEKCGTRIGQKVEKVPSLIETVSRPALGFSTQTSSTTPPPVSSVTPNSSVSRVSRIKKTYLWSALSAGICFILRLIMQEKFTSWDNLWENRYLLGIDSDIKPFLTAIPVIAAIIVSLIITSDTEADSQKKGTAFIVNGIYIALAILFIWFDIPYKIFDF